MTCTRESFDLIERVAQEYSYIAEEIGVTGSDRLSIKLRDVEHIAGRIDDFRKMYEGALESQLTAEVHA